MQLDGERRWPLARLRPAAERDPHPRPRQAARHLLRLLPGRPAARPSPTSQSKDDHEDGQGVRRAARAGAGDDPRPSATSGPSSCSCSATRSTSTRARRRPANRSANGAAPTTPPGEEVTDYEEYSWLYEESWSDPLIRWLLSTVSISMLWDDHDMSDDWNISALLARGDAAASPGGTGRAAAGIMSYWVYQHLGNLSPRGARRRRALRPGARQRPRDQRAARVRRRGRHDRRRAPAGASAATSATRRVIFIDSRAGRVLEEGERSIVDDEEWDWIVEHASGDFDHLLIATTVPYLLSPGFHHLEAWNERVCDGAWGGLAAQRRREAAPRRRLRPLGLLRQARSSGCASCSRRSAPASAGKAPASIVVLSGDVHHAYLAEVGFRPEARGRERRLPGGLLALPQPARRARAAGDQGRLLAPLHRRDAGARPRRRGRRPGNPLAPRRGPLLRQPGRDAPPRRARSADAARQDGRRARRTSAGSTASSSAGSPSVRSLIKKFGGEQECCYARARLDQSRTATGRRDIASTSALIG